MRLCVWLALTQQVVLLLTNQFCFFRVLVSFRVQKKNIFYIFKNWSWLHLAVHVKTLLTYFAIFVES